MLASFVALMEACENGTAPLTTGDLMQGAMFRRLSLLNEEAARALHTGPPAYTVSPLMCDHEEVRGVQRIIAEGDRTWFRITALNRQAAEWIFRMAQQTSDWELYTGRARARFRINHWRSLASEHPWSGQIDGDGLWQSAWAAMQRQPDRIWFDFESPAGFTVNPEAWPPSRHWPDAGLVFQSLARKRERFLPELAVNPALRPVEELVALGEYKVQSHALRFEKHGSAAAGFTGSCEFVVRPDATEEEAFWLHLLAGMAFYTGVGVKTSWGMGMTRRSRYRDFTYRGLM